MKKLFLVLQHCIPQHLLSRLIGRLADSRLTFLKNFLIRIFIRHYQVNMSEARRQTAAEYNCFNDFFTRQLQAEARPLASAPDAILSPVDGTVSAIGDIDDEQIFQAKGKSFRLQALLAEDADLISHFRGGKFATLYLSPRDYHRIHMPSSGKLEKMIYVPGKLFSVNQTTAEGIDNLFARNERAICHFQTEQGSLSLILVGALIVAGIETAWAGPVAPGQALHTETYQEQPPIQLARGEEMGLFKLGSTVILLFPAQQMSWDEELGVGSTIRMGQSIGRFHSADN
jgi:phosphatidylserine decarboxylase